VTLRRTYPDTLSTAAQLKAAGIIIGVISNHIVSPPWFQECASSAGLYELATDRSLVVVSQEVGVGKPDEAIFKLFFERLLKLDPNIQPEQLIFVDDKEANVEAARALGWKGLTFNASQAAHFSLASALANLGMGTTRATA